jgi:hypothetical protein
MKGWWTYLKYVLRHKYFVYREGRKLGLGFWQCFMHDMSKLSPTEFFPYMRKFALGLSDPANARAFQLAWLHHVHVNKHHWQYWCLAADKDGIDVIRMPEKYVKEMIADWRGVGLALNKGEHNAVAWYLDNRDTLALHPNTRSRVEALLGVVPADSYLHRVPHPIYRAIGS